MGAYHREIHLIWEYECPMAAVTNNHKWGDSKQLKSILSFCQKFWRPEAKNKVLAEPLKTPEKSLCPFPAAGGCQQSLTYSYITPVYVSIVIRALSLCLCVSQTLEILGFHGTFFGGVDPFHNRGVREGFSEEIISSGHLGMSRE